MPPSLACALRGDTSLVLPENDALDRSCGLAALNYRHPQPASLQSAPFPAVMRATLS